MLSNQSSTPAESSQQALERMMREEGSRRTGAGLQGPEATGEGGAMESLESMGGDLVQGEGDGDRTGTSRGQDEEGYGGSAAPVNRFRYSQGG